MQTTTSLAQEPVAQARTAAIAKPITARLNYLDTLRVILISLVIALHTAITYGALGGWPYTDPASTELSGILLTIVTTVVQAFSLGLYFFVSGYFTPASYDRKGLPRFWKDRLLRLAIPILLYTFFLNRIPQYFAAVASRGETRSFWDFFAQTFISSADEGPTWFIFALLLFSVGYTLWRLAARAIPSASLAWMNRLKVPGIRQILAFGLLVSLGMFVVSQWYPVNDTFEVFGIFNLMVVFFVQYILFFIAGILAYRNDWLARLNGKDLRFWAWLSLGLIVTLLVLFGAVASTGGSVDYFLGGLYWQAAAFMLWIGLFSVSVSMTLILWLRDQKKPQGRLMAFAGPNTYGVYLLHPLVLVPVAVAMSVVPLDPLLKFVIVLPLVVALTFLLADGLRRIPGVKSIL